MKFLFLASALFALYGSVVCTLPADLYGLGFVVKGLSLRETSMTTVDGVQYIQTEDGDDISHMVKMVDGSRQNVRSLDSGAAYVIDAERHDIGGIITTIDRRTTRSDGRTLITTEGGADVTIERQSDGTFKYINNSNEFELHELADGTYTHNGNSAEITPTEITVASTGEVFDHNGDPKEDSEDSEDDDKCVAPQTTCVIEDPCTSSSSSFGWNQWCKWNLFICVIAMYFKMTVQAGNSPAAARYLPMGEITFILECPSPTRPFRVWRWIPLDPLST